MRLMFFKFSTLPFYYWPWLKGGFYTFYFLFIQLTNNDTESPLVRFFVNLLFCAAAIGVIEITKYCLQLTFAKEEYKKTITILLGSYMLLAGLGYYTFHGQNILADEVWDKRFEATLATFLPGFTAFFGAFFKYGVILFLFKRLLVLSRLLGIKEQVGQSTPSKNSAETRRYANDIDRQTSGENNDVFLPLQNVNKIDDIEENLNSANILAIKIGATTHMLDIRNIVYLEVQDEITTVYQKDGSSLAIKIALSRFYERLPKDRFIKIHDSRVVALPFVKREEQGHLFVEHYEGKPLKMGKPERFPGYKRWKETNRLR